MLHESCVHIHQIWLSRKRGRRAHASDAAAHAVPAALPAFSMTKVATMALLATATHVVLMATSVVADILMVHDDDGVWRRGQPLSCRADPSDAPLYAAYQSPHSVPSTECGDQ